MWEDAGRAAGVPLRPISVALEKPGASDASQAGVDTGLESVEKRPFTAEDLFGEGPGVRKRGGDGETGRLYFSIVRS